MNHKPTGGFARVVHRQDVRVLEAGRELDLVLEPLGAERRRDVGVEDLERYEAVVLEIAGQVDRSHPAAAELPIEGVTVAKRVSERCCCLGHGRRASGELPPECAERGGVMP